MKLIIEILGRVGRIWRKLKGRRTKIYISYEAHEGHEEEDIVTTDFADFHRFVKKFNHGFDGLVWR